MDTKWIPCSLCGLRGIVKKAAGQLDGKHIFLMYKWICCHCMEPQVAVAEEVIMEDETQIAVAEEAIMETEPSDGNLKPLFNIQDEYFQEASVNEAIVENEEPIGYQHTLVKGRKLLYLNVNGIKSKYEEIRNLMINENGIILFGISESKLSTERDHANCFAIPGYHMIRRDREMKEGGGSLIYINNEFDFQICETDLTPPNNIECSVIRLQGQFMKPIYVCIMYIPPDDVNESALKFTEKVFCYLRASKSEFVIMGDLNIDWSSNTPESKCIKSLCKEMNIVQVVSSATRLATRNTQQGVQFSATVIDHIYVSNNIFQLGGNFNFTSSDHNLVYTVLKPPKQKIPPKLLEYRCFRKIDPEKFEEDFYNVDWNFLSKEAIQDVRAEMFEKCLLTLLDKHAPIKRRLIKGTNAPWFSNEIVQMCKKRNELRKQTNNEALSNDELARVVRDYKKLKNEITAKVRLAKRNFFKNKFSTVKTSADVWNVMDSMINFRNKRSAKITKLLSSEGKMIEDDDVMICDQFASEFIVDNAVSDVSSIQQELDNYANVYSNSDSCVLNTVLETEVSAAILHVKRSKHTDYNVPQCIYKKFSKLITLPLTVLMNCIILSGVIPATFKLGYVIPLYKGKGSTIQSSSYRAIFSFPFIVKVFERVVYCRLLKYVNELLDENQHGFRKQRSCETALSIFTQHIYGNVDKRSGKSVAVFIDFSKAFESVNQKLLMKKLICNFENKIPPYMLNLLKNYFSDRKFLIQNGGFTSKQYNIQSGVPPGSQLGPICYSLFVNDIGRSINLPYLLFADDLVIYTDCKTFDEGCNKMNECLKELEKWCKDNGLKINVSKTKYMVFYKAKDHKSRREGKGSITIGGNEVERVESFKYLGVVLDTNLDFEFHEKCVENKINAALSKMYTIRRMLTSKVMKTFLSAYVVSIIDYAIVIWAVDGKKLNFIQRKINRFLISFYHPNLLKKNIRSTKFDVNDLLRKIDLFTVSERRILSYLKFVFKKRYLKLFEGFFVDSKRNLNKGLFNRLQVVKHNSELFKQSIIWNGVNIWNCYLRSFSCVEDKFSNDSFVEMCRLAILKERQKIFF